MSTLPKCESLLQRAVSDGSMRRWAVTVFTAMPPIVLVQTSDERLHTGSYRVKLCGRLDGTFFPFPEKAIWCRIKKIRLLSMTIWRNGRFGPTSWKNYQAIASLTVLGLRSPWRSPLTQPPRRADPWPLWPIPRRLNCTTEEKYGSNDENWRTSLYLNLTISSLSRRFGVNTHTSNIVFSCSVQMNILTSSWSDCTIPTLPIYSE